MKLKFINLFLNDISEHKKINCVKMLLNNINNNITNIHQSLKNIKIKIEQHKNKLFYYYRKLCLENEKNNIMKNNKLMTTRFDLLIKILQIKL
jgi:hypothetical protein